MLKSGYKLSIWVILLIGCFCLFCTSPSYADTSIDVMDNMHVYQKETVYKSVRCYQDTASVYNSGCGLISINLACNFINGTDKSIDTMIGEIDGQIDRTNRLKDMYYRRFLDEKGKFYSGASSDTPKMIAEYYGLVATRFNISDDIDTLAQALTDGHCIWMNGIGNVFVGTDGNVKTRNGHCVMFYRYENGLFYCHDSCEKQYTTYTREQLETLHKCSISRCGTWIISKEKIFPDNINKLTLSSGNGQFNVYVKKPGEISGYQIRYRLYGEEDWIEETYPTSEDLDINIIDYNSDDKYQVQVRTFYSKGTGTYYSNWTASKTVKIKAYKAPSVAEYHLKSGNGQFDIYAENPGDISGYQIRYRVEGVKNWTEENLYDCSDNLYVKIRNVKAATKYQVQVRTFQNIDEETYFSDWTLYKAVRTKNAPCGTKVKSLTKAGPKAFRITADKTPSITGYQVAYRIKGSKKWTKIKCKTTDDLNKTVSGLKTNKTYQVKIRTYRAVGKNTYYSGWSGWKAIKLQKNTGSAFAEPDSFQLISFLF